MFGLLLFFIGALFLIWRIMIILPVNDTVTIDIYTGRLAIFTEVDLFFLLTLFFLSIHDILPGFQLFQKLLHNNEVLFTPCSANCNITKNIF